MRGKAKQRVSLILVVTMVLGTALTGNTVFATGESSDEQDRIKINISKDSEQTVEQNVAQTIHVTAQGQCSQSVCLNVYLKNEDGSAATDIDAVNLLTSDQLTDKNTQKTIDETLKDSVTLNDGTKTSPKAEWKNDKDENGTVTSKYLQITMPADATAINFDMQLQYRTDEASYTKKVLVEAKAFEEEQDITEAAKRADESKENETTVVWEGQAVSQPESEAADEDADGENNINTVSETGVYTLYFEQNTIDDPHSAWDNATQISVYAFSNNDNTGVLQMYKVPESDSKNIWKITFDKEWTHVIFLTGDDWSGFFNQTEDIQIDWSLNSPCYKLRGDAASDNRKKVDTPFEYKETPLAADGITVYYDATLSKLSYAKTENVKGTGEGIPHSEKGQIYFYATKDTGATPYTGTMEIASDGNYKDVYKVTLPKGYIKIRFAAYPVNNTEVAANGDATDLVDIPEKMTKPCYYGDSSDDIIYQDASGNRGGYWGEAYTVRDAERGKKNATVVDVPNATEKRDADNLYVNTTIYDYYSDYELNGKNRDNYPKQGDVTNNRIYQPFRQFNMALSDYYQKNQAKSPLYWGNFQNYSDSHFNDIAETMGLFGYNINSSNEKFFYENNSMWGRWDSKKPLPNGNNATQGLVADQLNNNSLQLETESNGTVLAPFFDKDFLNGNNSKNTVLGKVYENVTFPFVKKGMYWTFDSADDEVENKNLQLKYDDTDKYFLQSNTNPVRGCTTTGQTNDGNYFPLNSSDQSGDASRDQSGDASRLNYGFGQKFDLKFRLTSDGTVLDSDNKRVPIEFNFSGDDDVWVFIDGQLVLDIGGDHAVVTGKIDFANKMATVSSAKDSSLGGTSNGEVKKDFPKEFVTNNYFTKEHTLTMFYMERGLWESNMKITFNFPQENKLTVEKEVDTTGANEIFKNALADVGTFDFEIKNLATSGDPKDVSEPSSPEVKKVFNDYSDNTTISGTRVYDSKVEVEKDPTESGKENIISYYYPGKKNATDPQSKTDERLVRIKAKDSNGFDASKSKGYKYLQFDVYNTDANASGTDPFVALVDGNGTRIGAWASFLTYNGRNNNIDKQTWKTIRIDLEKLKENTLDAGETSEFDFSKVKEIQFAYWNDVTIYIDKFSFVKPASGEKTGFTTEQKDIPDYGSINSNKLEPVNGSYYQNTKGDTIIYSDGLLSIGNKESAIFSDQFRRGSYLSIAEKNVSPDVFTTTWSLYENGAIVNPSDLRKTTDKVTGDIQTSVEKQSGYEVNDGRTENSDTVTKPSDSTIVFRSYANPDSTTAVIDLKAKYVNKLRTGSISLKKSLSEGERESLSGRKYQFRIEYRNIAGMKLEANTGRDVITQEINLAADEQYTINGIPAGTDYTIYEVIPKDADYSLEKVEVTDDGNDKNVKAENNVVTGIVVADDDANSTDTAVRFVNTVTPLISISGTKTWEGEMTADTPKNIVVQIQRSISGTDFEQAKDKFGNPIPNQVVNIDTDWKYTFTGLLKYVNYQEKPQREYKYRVVELGTLKSSKELNGTKPDQQNLEHIKQIAGYYPEYKDGSFDITNKKTGTLKIIKKTGKDDFLEGAAFTLYTDSDTTEVAKDYLGNNLTGTTGTNGELIFNNIITGTEEKPITYYLKEVKTKAGYVLLKEPIKITLPYKYNKGDIVNGNKVTENGVTWNLTYTIINDKAFDLPASGNKGIFKFIVIGITAVLVGGYLLTARKKSRKKRVSRRG
ncbi:SpaA isopeptide-forming pilin-related protein [Mediterraneibacter faecis]|uniref:SpaA isopeptide-forming pilin-related protein n=1 Tax=Mediterraneibacter faecis TaxID=592978 RepID=UPI0018A8A0C0|nr:SpaA isopeptide-forming pilin-related protein [Mediterraneibacter faecis]